MTRKSESPEAQQAARYLAELLQLQPYRKLWFQSALVTRARRGDVHHGAVARVLATHLRANPRKGYPEDPWIRGTQLEPLVSRVLSRGYLSTQTLQLFITVFRISDEHASRLWRLYEGTDKIRVLTDISVIPPKTAAALQPARHRTLSVHEHHYLGSDGLPARHRTQQVIQATAEKLDRYPYRFDTNALTVEVEEGGYLVGPLYQVYDDIYAIDILLDEALAHRETTVLSYVTVFHYQEAPRSEFRRAAQGEIKDVSIRVAFHPDKLPMKVWWGTWEGVEGEMSERESVALKKDGSISRHLEAIENTVVGFCWEWQE
jgi:hypothetical protein